MNFHRDFFMISFRLLNSFFLLALSRQENDDCLMYLAPSRIPNGGRGIIAGVVIGNEEVVDVAPSIPVLNSLLGDSQLHHYVFDSWEQGISMVVLGPTMIFNHGDQRNVQIKFNNIETSWKYHLHTELSSTLHVDMNHETTRPLLPGEEMLTSYGGAPWFKIRNISFDRTIKPELYELEELKKVGHCITDIYVALSSLPLASRGLFGRVKFRAGDLVSISPVLALSKSHWLKWKRNAIVMNYCFSSPNSDLLLLPIGIAAMANHGGKARANLRVDWYIWDNAQEEHYNNMNKSVGELQAMKQSPFSLGYYALRDIEENEELYLDYGEDWERDWGLYLEDLQHWRVAQRPYKHHGPPAFRHFINAPDYLYSSKWSDGTNGDSQACVVEGTGELEGRNGEDADLTDAMTAYAQMQQARLV